MDKTFWELTFPSAAACSSDSLPDVLNANYYSDSTDLVPGTIATIECYEGYHFPGTPVAITTPVPILHFHSEPARCEHFYLHFGRFHHYIEGGFIHHSHYRSTKKKTATITVNPSTKKGCDWLLGGFLFGAEK